MTKFVHKSPSKKCIRCNSIKTLSRSFYKNKQYDDGYSNVCKLCTNKRSKKLRGLKTTAEKVSGKKKLTKTTKAKPNKMVEIVVSSVGMWLSDSNRKIVYDYYSNKWNEIIDWLSNNKEDGLVYLLGVEELGLGKRSEFFGEKNWDKIDGLVERKILFSLEEYMEDLLCKMIVKNVVDNEVENLMKRFNKKVGGSGV